jgi:hypothetical protein
MTRLFTNPYNISNSALNDKITAFMLSTRASFRLRVDSSLTVYENYAHGDEGPDAWYNSAKLPADRVEETLGPEEVVHFTNPIPT